MNKKAFTLSELLVSISIIIILSTIGVMSYVSYIGNARDTQRKSDISQISSALRLIKQQRGVLPMPGSKFDLMYNGTIVAYQGKLNSDVPISTMDKVLLDPLNGMPYTYSITENQFEYQVSAVLENSGLPEAIVEGNYSSVSVNVLPSIIIAEDVSPGSSISIDSSNSFVLSNQTENLPYTFDEPYSPVVGETPISEIIESLKIQNLYWQNSGFRSCDEIEEAGKAISGLQKYQIISPTTGEWVEETCPF